MHVHRNPDTQCIYMFISHCDPEDKKITNCVNKSNRDHIHASFSLYFGGKENF